MRALMMVAALCCAVAVDASAQPRGEATGRDQVVGIAPAPPAPDSRSLQNACIVSEMAPAPPSFFPPGNIGAYTHSFYLRNEGDSDTYRIDVSTNGLRLNSATQVAAIPGSVEGDQRAANLIDVLRAAAVSRSKFRIDARSSRVTQVIVYWNSRCPGT